jgi:hypothetical protein
MADGQHAFTLLGVEEDHHHDDDDEPVATLRDGILLLLSSDNLTNQQIRKKLHRYHANVNKLAVNKTLHQMKEEGVLNFRAQGRDKVWFLV